MKKILIFSGIFILLLSHQVTVVAQDSGDDLAAQSQNPIASLVSVPFQFNFNLNTGPDYDRMQTVLNIQPVLPIAISDKWNMINRIIVPLIVQPDFNTGSDEITGMGNINYTAFFAPPMIGKIAYGFGPSLVIPTNTSSELGTGQFTIGPSLVLFAGVGKWTLGFLAANNWSYNHPDGAVNQNSFLFQYFVNLNFKKGWSIGMSPIITVDWTADDDERALIPFGLSGSKITKLGKQNAKFELEYYYNAFRPTGAAKGGQIQFTLVLLYPKGK